MAGAECDFAGTTNARHRRALQEPRDLTPGDHDVPPFNLGGQDMYAISPDGQEVAYTSNIDEVEATSTNDEIFVVPITGRHRQRKFPPAPAPTLRRSIRRTEISAWRSQARAGFEADKWQLLVQDRQSGKRATRPISGIVGWQLHVAAGFEAICFAAEDRGQAPILQLDFTDASSIRTNFAPGSARATISPSAIP